MDRSLRESQASNAGAQLYLTRLSSLRYTQSCTNNSSTDKAETSLEHQEHFSQIQYDSCAPLSHTSSCMLVNHGFSWQRRIQALKMRCYCKKVSISYKDYITNKEVCQAQAGNQATWRSPANPKVTQTEVVWTCLPSSGLTKTILQGTKKGGRRQGRQEEEVGRQY